MCCAGWDTFPRSGGLHSLSGFPINFLHDCREIVPCSSVLGLLEQYHKPRWLKQISGTYYHTVLEVRSLSWGTWAGLVPSEDCLGGSVLCLAPSLWQFAGNLWSSSACRSITLIYAFSFTCCSPCVDTSVHIFPFYEDWIKSPPISMQLHVN